VKALGLYVLVNLRKAGKLTPVHIHGLN